MLATFTANLAAFLTVERMQTTVQSLEELVRWSNLRKSKPRVLVTSRSSGNKAQTFLSITNR